MKKYSGILIALSLSFLVGMVCLFNTKKLQSQTSLYEFPVHILSSDLSLVNPSCGNGNIAFNPTTNRGFVCSNSLGTNGIESVINPGPTYTASVAVGATLALTSANCGTLIKMGATSGEVVTLPAAATSTIGCTYDFIVTVSNTSNSNEIQTTGSNYLLGAVLHSATGIAPLDFWADGSSIKAIKMDGAHLGGLIGSTFHIVGLSATQWEISGTNEGTATMTTAFNATP